MYCNAYTTDIYESSTTHTKFNNTYQKAIDKYSVFIKVYHVVEPIILMDIEKENIDDTLWYIYLIRFRWWLFVK